MTMVEADIVLYDRLISANGAGVAQLHTQIENNIQNIIINFY